MARYLAKHRPRRQPRHLLLLISLTATAVAFLAPVAQADPVLSVAKASTDTDGGALNPGDIIEYSITISNDAAAPDAADDPVLVDDVPANTTYVPGSATVDDGTVIDPSTNPFGGAGQQIADIAAGDSTVATYQVQVITPLPNGTVITNSADVSADNDAAAPVTSNTTSDTVTSAPSLSVTKTADPPEGFQVTPGETIDYTVVVENLSGGTDTATGVTITDPTPANTTYVPGSAEVDGTTVPGPTNPFQTDYPLGDLVPGDSAVITFQVTVNPGLVRGTPITNTATAGATNSPDVSDGAAHTVSSTPGLSLDKTASPAEGGPISPGETITYTVTVANHPLATGAATEVAVTDQTPAHTSYVADSASVDGTPVPGSSNPFENGYDLPDMAPGDSHTLTFQVVVDSPLDNGTMISNTASVDSAQGSMAGDSTTHTTQSAPQLSIAKTSAPAEGAYVTPGATITYSIVVTNHANANEVADDLQLVDPTPSNTSYVQGSGTLNGAAVGGTGNPFGTAFNLPELDPGESHTITFGVRVNAPLARGTVISNQARLTAENHANVQDAATHTVDSAPVLRLLLFSTPDPGTRVKADDTLSYWIIVANDPAATESLTNVRVLAPTPDGTTFIEGTARVDGRKLNAPAGLRVGSAVAAPGPFPGGYSLGTMAPGTDHTLAYRVRVKPSADLIMNEVTVIAENSTANATVSHRGPDEGTSAGGAGGGGGPGGSGGGGGGGGVTTGGSGTTTGGTTTGGDLAFTGLDLMRLVLLAISLLLAGWILIARGRALQRRMITGRSDEPVPSTGSATVDRWVDAWFYSESRR